MHKIYFENGDSFTPSKIIGVGRNYVAHIKEMESERTKEPVLFLKPNSAICNLEQTLSIPTHLGSVHHEVELAIAIKKEATKISTQQVSSHIAGYAIGLDLTLRDIQSKAKQKGLPWALAKGFNASCPLSKFVETDLELVQNTTIQLSKNGNVMQDSNTRFMIFDIKTLISHISHYFTLLPGDVILTGTPAGVGPLSAGDTLQAHIDHVGTYKTDVDSNW